MNYLHFDDDGVLCGRYYSEGFTGQIPADAVEVSCELYDRTVIEDDGIWKLVNGEIVKTPIPVAPEPEPAVPQSVTPAQGLMAMYALKGITEDDILAAIGTIEDPALRYQAQIAYKKATRWERASVSMQVVAGLLALTEPDLDELFTLAPTFANL